MCADQSAHVSSEQEEVFLSFVTKILIGVLLYLKEAASAMVWRCNGSTAGQDYLEVIWIVLEKGPQWSLWSSIGTLAVSLCPHFHAVGYGQSE
jgi:hypothetical protein